MGMNIYIRTKNDIEYGGRFGENYIDDFIEALENLESQEGISFIFGINDESDYIELCYSRFIEAYNKVKNHVQDIQDLYQEAFNQPTCIKQDLIVIEYF